MTRGNSVQILIPVEEASGIAEARRRVAALAASLGFDGTTAGALAVAVTEAATNIVKHATRGSIVARSLEAGDLRGVEVVALDTGRGIPNLRVSMRDGHSTAGTAGNGLGTLQRMTTGLDIYSQAGKGTVLRFEVWQPGARQPGAYTAGAICLPKPRETVCGDDWAVLAHRDRLILFMADGLGHGPDAASASRAAVGAVTRHAGLKAAEIMDAAHAALRPTRGAAAAVAILQGSDGLCTFCGVGNIAASIRVNGTARNLVSHNGILGHQVRKMQEFQYPFPPGAILVAHSDGLATRWDLESYPGLENRHPTLLAATLYRDHLRGNDDVTVVALRAEGSPRA